MNHDLKVNLEILIDAGKSEIWKVLTTPEIIRKYLFGAEVLCTWKEGDEIIFQGDYQGQKYRDKGIIQKFDQERSLIYTYWSGFSGLTEEPKNYSLVSYVIEPISEKQSKLHVSQKGFKDDQSLSHGQSAWKSSLDQIKELCEN